MACVELSSIARRRQEDRMIQFQRYYLGYRRVGLNRLDAFRFAWLVTTAGLRLIPIRPLPGVKH